MGVQLCLHVYKLVYMLIYRHVYRFVFVVYNYVYNTRQVYISFTCLQLHFFLLVYLAVSIISLYL